MFVALRNFSVANGKYFCTGSVVPDEFATPRAIETGCVAKAKETKILTETKNAEPKQILTEDSSNVKVEVTEPVKEVKDDKITKKAKK